MLRNINFYVAERHVKTGNTHINIEICEYAGDIELIPRQQLARGKSLRLTHIHPSGDYNLTEIFSAGNWFGHYYDKVLCGEIRM